MPRAEFYGSGAAGPWLHRSLVEAADAWPELAEAIDDLPKLAEALDYLARGPG